MNTHVFRPRAKDRLRGPRTRFLLRRCNEPCEVLGTLPRVNERGWKEPRAVIRFSDSFLLFEVPEGDVVPLGEIPSGAPGEPTLARDETYREFLN